MCKGKSGFTLIEVMVAISILLGGLLALLYSVVISMNTNIENVIRDEAITIAAERMNAIRNINFDNMEGAVAAGTPTVPTVEQRDFRGVAMTFTVRPHKDGDPGDTITAPAYGSTANYIKNLSSTTKSIQVVVLWQYKGRTFQHSITSMAAKGL